MDDLYVELMWRVVKDRELRAAFFNLAEAREYAEKIGGTTIVITHRELLPSTSSLIKKYPDLRNH